jgi:hypothetical protein
MHPLIFFQFSEFFGVFLSLYFPKSQIVWAITLLGHGGCP